MHFLKSLLEYSKLIYYIFRPKTIFVRRFSTALGDTLLLTGLLPVLREKYPKFKIVVESSRPEIFFSNPYVDWHTTKHIKTTKKHIKPKYVIAKNSQKSFYLQLGEYVKLDCCLYPELYLGEKEKLWAKSEFGVSYIVVCPTGKQGFSSNRKEWGIENFQEVVDGLFKYKFVQIGMPKDPLLKNVVDARGFEFRKSASILSNSLFFFGLEGGIMHLAKALGKRSFIIYGGFISPEISGYSENINFYNKVDCSPCLNSEKSLGKCDSMKCMKGIKPKQVLKLVKERGFVC